MIPVIGAADFAAYPPGIRGRSYGEAASEGPGYDGEGNDYLFHGSVSGLNLKSVVALLRRRWESRFIPLGCEYF